jgi:hypothetical protein
VKPFHLRLHQEQAMQDFLDKYIFEIAVYNTDPDRFFTEREKRLQEHLKWIAQMGGVEPDQAPDTFENAEQYFLKKYGGWQFTQAIGWIRLFVLGKQIRGEYWFVDSKRINRDMNKRKFENRGKILELSFFPKEDSSLQIYQKIYNAINFLKKEQPFIGHYIDSETFTNIGKFINWHDLLGLDL